MQEMGLKSFAEEQKPKNGSHFIKKLPSDTCAKSPQANMTENTRIFDVSNDCAE